MKDLQPCPFCGGEVSITYYPMDNVFAIWHKHDGCKFIEPMYIDGDDAESLSDARNIWNKRFVLNAERSGSMMPDREKVIKGVHDARRYLEDREWVDKSVGVHIDALNDALSMLKEQEEDGLKHYNDGSIEP